jgi:phage-related tail fiber protein
MSYRTIHTLQGLRRMAQAEAASTQITLTHMAVGDGGGNAIEPSAAQTQLVREMYRAPINAVYQDDTDPTQFIVELVLPADVGGWTVREAAAFEADGSMVIVSSQPPWYKPLPEEGAFGDGIVRLAFQASNAEVVTLVMDPNVSVATRSWVQNNVTPALLLPGGTTGQVLRKTSNADGDTQWTDLGAVNVVVDCIEEKQALVDGQVQVVLTECTTRGLAVYVDGKRQPDDAWTKHPTDVTKFSFNTPISGTHELIAAQNEPTGDAPAPLERSRNLADVESAATARANLGVLSADETRQMAPPGAVMHFARTTAPAGWLKANGAAVSRTAYAALFAALGTTFGAGDGFNTFNLPDLRGEFLRGLDDGRGVDAGRALGSAQADANRSHTHSASSTSAGSHAHSGSTDTAASHTHTGSTNYAGDHGHTGTTDTTGAHQHATGWGENSATAAAPYGALGTSTHVGSGRTDTDNQEWLSAWGGQHSHTLNVNSAGSHQHTVSVGGSGAHSHSVMTASAGAHTHDITVTAAGGSESRPRNVALLACIKF